MKNKFFYSGLLALTILLGGCEENFSPKAEFQQKYALNCIIRGDTTFQTASISMSYDVPGFDPYSNHTDPFLSGATIRIWDGNDSVYFFRDSSVARSDTSRYNTPFHFYYLKGFQPKPLDSLEILAVLPNGKKLHAYTRVPDKVVFDTLSDGIVPDSVKPDFTEYWLQNSNIGWYIPKLLLYYRINVNGTVVTKTKEVALNYTVVNGVPTPVYPKPQRLVQITYKNRYLDSAMVQISRGDPNKGNYRVMAAILNLLIFDEDLSKYYSNMNGYYDDYTVRVDITDYTNIEGGFGIFGSFIKIEKLVVLTNDYIHSFGYQGPDD